MNPDVDRSILEFSSWQGELVSLEDFFGVQVDQKYLGVRMGDSFSF